MLAPDHLDAGMMTEASVWCEEVPEHGEGGELNPADLKDRDPLQLGLPPPDGMPGETLLNFFSQPTRSR